MMAQAQAMAQGGDVDESAMTAMMENMMSVRPSDLSVDALNDDEDLKTEVEAEVSETEPTSLASKLDNMTPEELRAWKIENGLINVEQEKKDEEQSKKIQELISGSKQQRSDIQRMIKEDNEWIEKEKAKD